MNDTPKEKGLVRKVARWGCLTILCISLVAAIALGVLLREGLYARFYLFPQRAAAWEAIRAQRQEIPVDDGWNEFRAVMHSHSELSHDSIVSFPEIVEVLHATNTDAIFMSDHCVDGKANYSLQWKGLHDGILFVRGFEMSGGFMPWGLPDGTVFDCGEDLTALAQKIETLGGALFYAHPEEERLWDLPQLTGMEIYNLHADMKDEKIGQFAPAILLGLWKYPDQTLRLLFDRQTAILAHWDELNQTRKITGIAANDCHQNVGVRAHYTARDTFLLRDTGHEDRPIVEWKLNLLTRPLIRLLFGKLEPDKQLFRVDLDPYVEMARFAGTHILARECTEPALIEALRQGRAFVAFDMMADGRGFIYMAETPGVKAVMGETIVWQPGLKLRVASPYPCRFTLVQDGQSVAQSTGRSADFSPAGPGKFRIEAELDILGEWTPWVYTNPIDVRAT